MSTPKEWCDTCMEWGDHATETCRRNQVPLTEQPQGQVGATAWVVDMPLLLPLIERVRKDPESNYEGLVEAFDQLVLHGMLKQSTPTPSLQKVREALKVASKDLHLSPTCAIGKVFQKECIRCQAERALPLLSQPQPQSEAGDKERADWYEKNHLTLTFEPGFNAWGTHQRITAGVVFNKKGKTWREAVDAMQAEKGVV